jgi:hypothetical protein
MTLGISFIAMATGWFNLLDIQLGFLKPYGLWPVKSEFGFLSSLSTCLTALLVATG